MKQKNLLFFMTDQQRIDTLHRTVGDQPITPNLSAFAEKNIEYTTAYNTCPLCIPSRTALATGKNPIAGGMPLNDVKGVLAQPHETIHTLLAGAGYAVAHIGINHIRVHPGLEHRLPYAAWEDEDTYETFIKAQGIDPRRSPKDQVTVKENRNGVYEDSTYSNARVSLWEHELKNFKDIWFTDRAVDFIQQDHDKPFALFVYLWAPHPPLIVPPEYLELFPIENIALPPGTDQPLVSEPESRRKGIAAQMGEHPPEQGWKEGWSAHCALSRLCDDQFGKLLQALQEKELLEDTVIAFTTDHGEMMGQNRMYQKMEMYEPAVRVPAIFGVPEFPCGRYETGISHLDFLPTLLELLEVSEEGVWEGQSLAPFMKSGEEPPAKDLFGCYSGNHAFGDTRRMIVRDRWKYVWDGAEGELFDLSSDPQERNNLSGKSTYTAKEASLHQALKEWSAASGDNVPYETKTP